jgi:hypothetical protein
MEAISCPCHGSWQSNLSSSVPCRDKLYTNSCILCSTQSTPTSSVKLLASRCASIEINTVCTPHTLYCTVLYATVCVDRRIRKAREQDCLCMCHKIFIFKPASMQSQTNKYTVCGDSP